MEWIYSMGMIARLGPENILHLHGLHILSSQERQASSWFIQVDDLCQQYSLPSPLHLLKNPPSKPSLKKLVRQKVLDWWTQKFRTAAAKLDSLYLFRANFMSLSRPHPIWTSAGCSSYEVRKATVQAKMLSGRYRTCWLRRHWSGDPTGTCRIPGCSGSPGTLSHLATGQCPGLASAVVRAVALWAAFLKEHPLLFPVVKHFSLGNPEDFLAFLVDPTTRPQVITLSQKYGTIIFEHLCYLTRTWLFQMHKQRLKLLQLWK